MDIDCLLILECEDGVLPRHALFWVDPSWEGKWVKRSPAQEAESRAVFRVQYRMNPQYPVASMRAHKERPKLLNSSVNVQFFDACKRKVTNIPDFLYSSVFPLSEIEGGRLSGPWGLWNSNLDSCDGMEGYSLQGYRLMVKDCKPLALPREISLRNSEDAPSSKTHSDFILVAHWLHQALNHFYAEEKTTFNYLRTFGRNPWSDMFLFDLQPFFKDEGGTNLPPTLALYILCNALIVHGLNPKSYFESVSSKEGLHSKRDIERWLEVNRDILMAFTMCLVEGKYRDDLRLNKVVEDVWYQFSQSMEGVPNVYAEGDCEDRNQQGCVHIPHLFCCMAKDFQENQGQNVFAHLQQYRNASYVLQVSDDTLEALCKLAYLIGGMYLDGRMQALMCVGDGAMTCFDPSQVLLQTQNPDAPKQGHVDGHSFGVLLFRNGEDQGAMVLETTGYQSKVQDLPSLHAKDVLRQRKIRATMQQAALLIEKDNNDRCMSLRVPLTQEQEDELFVKVYAGNNTLFFTQDSNGKLSFGAKPSMLNRRFQRYQGHESAKEVRRWGECCLLVSPLSFMEALVDERGPWQTRMENAGVILTLYKSLVAKYPSLQQCTMPPQDTEAEFMRRITAHWGVIHEDDLPEEGRFLPSDVVLAIRKGSHKLDSWLSQCPVQSMRSHDFMGSVVHRLYF